MAIIGHSMGGLVARALLTLKNFKQDLINLLVTQATPHVAPVMPLDRFITGEFEHLQTPLLPSGWSWFLRVHSLCEAVQLHISASVLGVVRLSQSRLVIEDGVDFSFQPVGVCLLSPRFQNASFVLLGNGSAFLRVPCLKLAVSGSHSSKIKRFVIKIV